jgi:hypothetical protein
VEHLPQNKTRRRRSSESGNGDQPCFTSRSNLRLFGSHTRTLCLTFFSHPQWNQGCRGARLIQSLRLMNICHDYFRSKLAKMSLKAQSYSKMGLKQKYSSILKWRVLVCPKSLQNIDRISRQPRHSQPAWAPCKKYTGSFEGVKGPSEERGANCKTYPGNRHFLGMYSGASSISSSAEA